MDKPTLEEQVALVQWLELQGLKFTAVPNSTYTKSWKQKAHNKATGVRAGFPDIIVLISPDQSVDGRGFLLALELKRIKGGTVSAEQKLWIKALNDLDTPHVASYIAKGAEQAIDIVGKHLKSKKGIAF